MRDRRPEERHDAVAHHLVDRPLVAVDGLHHAFEDWVEKFPSLFGITVREQLHRPFEVSKEQCDLLALPFDRILGSEDLLNKVLGGVDFGRTKPRLDAQTPAD